ncbi:MAG: HlyC/CorC family transporter [Coriobacteriia bacterium]|nr:HlyC/CorC family transporter [Coriobacteriia bacterium]MBN2839452.1 HlyC/CorC family transporter [Coriobacteriia bacterium]
MNVIIQQVILILILIVFNGFLSAAEIALVSARRAVMKMEADAGSRSAQTVLRLTEDPGRFMAAIQIGITLVGFGASATAAVTLAEPLAGWLSSLGVSWVTPAASGLAVFLVTLVISYVTLVVGELAPKRLGLARAETVAKLVAGPVSLLQSAAAPIIWILTRSTDVVARLFGMRPGSVRPGVTEEEIKLLVTEQGTLLEDEKRMIHEIFELGDMVAKEIMVPRVDMRMLEDTVLVGEAIGVFRDSGYSRLPVFSGDADSIVGIAMLKDLVGPVATGRLQEPVASFVRPAVFVPETKPILVMLKDMQQAHNHLAIVVDEYGGTAGLVTIEDIVEEIIGEVVDEFDRERRYITTIGPGEWVVDGLLSVHEANETLGWDLPTSDEYETVAGWLLVQLGHIPTGGEVVHHHDLTVRVDAVRRRRIARLRVSHAQENSGGSDSGS